MARAKAEPKPHKYAVISAEPIRHSHLVAAIRVILTAHHIVASREEDWNVWRDECACGWRGGDVTLHQAEELASHQVVKGELVEELTNRPEKWEKVALPGLEEAGVVVERKVDPT